MPSSDNLKNLLGIQELRSTDIQRFLLVSKILAPTLTENNVPPLLKGKSIVNLFFEDSTRTRVSFEIAIRKLGGVAIHFSASNSSLSKGETLLDTAKNIEAMNPDALIVRHASAGSPKFLASQLKIPVINAGDGFHEHPTQALLDLYTLEEKLGTVAGKKILILGDIAHSRVARSNIFALNKLGAKVWICGPPTLLPPEPNALGVKVALRPEEVLAEMDAVMTLRIQLERQNQMQVPSLGEYAKFWGLNKARAALLKRTAIILDPGPVNQGIQIDPEVMEDPRCLILNQVSNGILVRMAALSIICAPERLKEWLETEGKNV